MPLPSSYRDEGRGFFAQNLRCKLANYTLVDYYLLCLLLLYIEGEVAASILGSISPSQNILDIQSLC